jgi:predicted lipoprotein with Yx(FWY)xxD motif
MLKFRVVLLLALLLLVGAAVQAQDGPTVGMAMSEALGPHLVGPNGMTLYSFSPDPLNASVCEGRCAEAWPPLLAESAEAALTLGEGIPGSLSTFERPDGTFQVAYNGIPLYYWFRDENVGDATGHYVGRVWWIVPPATVYAQRIPDLGNVLVGPGGMTLYMFTNDADGMSACYDQCATNWPPLTVESADAIVPGLNLPGTLGTTERTDGSLQVTYNDMPLYYWKDDAAIGDATGEGVGEIWYTVAPETVAVGSSDELGDFLVAANGLTLYMFTNDTEGVSNCSGECLENWPAFTVSADDRLVAGAGITGELATLTRDDGSLQVTYNGMPLYYWTDDAAPGMTAGQGLGDVWFVVAP